MTQFEISENERYFKKVFALTNTFFWKDLMELFEITGNHITCTKRGYKAMNAIVSNRFMSQYKFTIK